MISSSTGAVTTPGGCPQQVMKLLSCLPNSMGAALGARLLLSQPPRVLSRSAILGG
jgi:hypothetical protein